ncbi:MAG: hypothetical protein IKD92_07350 [Lachnospiraceae bacterium]|nr:hypothetical protein [Lachnospiraceae bacterium]
MAMEKIGDGLKKFLLVGIGAAAITVEKSQQIVDDLVKKGEITVEQGKELNKELQHNVKKTLDAHKADAGTLEEKIAKMSAEEIELLKKAIRNAESTATKLKDKIAEASDVIEEEAAAAADEKSFEDDLKKEGYMVSDEE